MTLYRSDIVQEYLHEKYGTKFFDVVLNTLLHRQCGYYTSMLRKYNILFFHQVSERLKINLKNLGKEIIVRQNGTKEKGIFKGIDENAALLMETPAGVKKILAGDVFFEEINKKDE